MKRWGTEEYRGANNPLIPFAHSRISASVAATKPLPEGQLRFPSPSVLVASLALLEAVGVKVYSHWWTSFPSSSALRQHPRPLNYLINIVAPLQSVMLRHLAVAVALKHFPHFLRSCQRPPAFGEGREGQTSCGPNSAGGYLPIVSGSMPRYGEG